MSQDRSSAAVASTEDAVPVVSSTGLSLESASYSLDGGSSWIAMAAGEGRTIAMPRPVKSALVKARFHQTKEVFRDATLATLEPLVSLQIASAKVAGFGAPVFAEPFAGALRDKATIEETEGRLVVLLEADWWEQYASGSTAVPLRVPLLGGWQAWIEWRPRAGAQDSLDLSTAPFAEVPRTPLVVYHPDEEGEAAKGVWTTTVARKEKTTPEGLKQISDRVLYDWGSVAFVEEGASATRSTEGGAGLLSFEYCILGDVYVITSVNPGANLLASLEHLHDGSVARLQTLENRTAGLELVDILSGEPLAGLEATVELLFDDQECSRLLCAWNHVWLGTADLEGVVSPPFGARVPPVHAGTDLLPDILGVRVKVAGYGDLLDWFPQPIRPSGSKQLVTLGLTPTSAAFPLTAQPASGELAPEKGARWQICLGLPDGDTSVGDGEVVQYPNSTSAFVAPSKGSGVSLEAAIDSGAERAVLRSASGALRYFRRAGGRWLEADALSTSFAFSLPSGDSGAAVPSLFVLWEGVELDLGCAITQRGSLWTLRLPVDGPNAVFLRSDPDLEGLPVVRELTLLQGATIPL